MSKEWYLPTGRTADEFMAEMKGNLRHDAEHLFGRIRQADQRIAELEARVEPLQPFKERIAELQARLDAVLNAEFLGGENGVTPMIVSDLETVQVALE